MRVSRVLPKDWYGQLLNWNEIEFYFHKIHFMLKLTNFGFQLYKYSCAFDEKYNCPFYSWKKLGVFGLGSTRNSIYVHLRKLYKEGGFYEDF